MNYKISVIIPVYNGEKTIRETIESVLKQSFSNLEIIVIDDGSTDSTVATVKSISDSRLQLFSYSNAGLAASRNRGISKVHGEYVSFIDADDLWMPDKLESQLKLLLEYPNSAVAYSWTDYIDTNGKFLKSGRRTKDKGDVYSKLLLSNFLENGSNPLISIDALKAVGGFDKALPAAEDWDMWLRLAAKYEFVCVEKVHILYRISSYSMSTNIKRQEVASLKVIERAFNHPKAETLQHLKSYSLAQLYKYLTFKAIESLSNQQEIWNSVLCLWNWMKNEPFIIQQWRLILIAGCKVFFLWLFYCLSKFRAYYLN